MSISRSDKTTYRMIPIVKAPIMIRLIRRDRISLD